MKKQVFLVAMTWMWGLSTVSAQQVLTLDSCRAWAIRNNKETLQLLQASKQ